MTLTGATGTSYTLGDSPIGSGAEGDIYRAFIVKVAKIYKPGTLTPELVEKLKVMIEHPPSESVLSQVAWPLDMVYDENGMCSGFIMPELEINAELGEIYKYPSALPISAQQKINIAKNICVVISEVHKAGYVFGDFNPRNIGLNKDTGLVSFLDTDTYHVVDSASGITYRCNVCAAGYAAPELLDKCSVHIADNPMASKNAYAQTPLPTFTRETDYFALAIHIFKLLMNGYTPFGGIIETASVSRSSPGVGDAAIRRDSYCFKPGYKAQSAAIPPLDAFPDEIADLFTRAFIEGRADPGRRPTAVEWYGALVRLEQALVTCPHNKLHQFAQKNTSCPLCEADRRFSAAMTGGFSEDNLVQTPYSPPPQVASVLPAGTGAQTPKQPPVHSQVHPPKQTAKQPLAHDYVYTAASASAKPGRKNQSASKLRIGAGKHTISAGSFHSAAIAADGSLWMWGDDAFGQLGDGSGKARKKPEEIWLDGVASVSSGYTHTMAVKADGSLWAWGGNDYGQLGVGTPRVRYKKPKEVKSIDNVVAVSSGYYHTLAIRTDGTLWAWGYNGAGRLGDGRTHDRNAPEMVMVNVVRVSAGESHTVALASDGVLWAWGENDLGQLGDGTTENRLVPVKIMDNVINISAGDGHTLAITSNGKLWAWGWNEHGQLGNGKSKDQLKPIEIMDDVTGISAGAAFSMAIKKDGSLWTWGSNQDGELGDGSTIDQLKPIRIMDDVVAVSTGDAYSMAVRRDGSLLAWGSNEYGQLGDGTTTNRRIPVKILDNVMRP